MTSDLRSVILLGSTGSIGTQARQVIEANRDRFRVTGLTAAGSDLRALAEQVVALDADVVGIAHGDPEILQDLIGAEAQQRRADPRRREILSGPQAATEVAGRGADVVLNGITGSIGLRPTLAALASGATLALANKESLIVGGDLVRSAARPDQIVPVDSEHSAIAQCLRSGRRSEVRRLIVTASGGPFRGRNRDELAQVTPAEALAHPNFSMGRVVTTNSATLVNKGLEVIEAHLLFDLPFDDITVVVHPQQQIHSMVEFIDGSTIAQAGPPRMLVPIALGLSWPERLGGVDAPCDWTAAQSWDFLPLDEQAFPSVPLAYAVGRAGGTFPAVYNAANEVCVDAFHDGSIRFLDIVDTVSRVVEDHESTIQGKDDPPLSVEWLLDAEQWARTRTRELLGLNPLGGML